MRRYWLAVALVAGCWRSAPPPPPALGNQAAETAVDPLVMTHRGVGPIDERTEATEAALQQLFPRWRVVTTDLGDEAGIVFYVFDGAHELMYVVPDDSADEVVDDSDERRYAGTVFAVFAVSPRIRVEGRAWRVGAELGDVAGIDKCECWGDGEVTACYAERAQVRVIFEEPCADAERDGATAMIGKSIARVMWKRVPE